MNASKKAMEYAGIERNAHWYNRTNYLLPNGSVNYGCKMRRAVANRGTIVSEHMYRE
jgi:hypothetical protein